jgi:chromosome segregation ATPase
MDTIKKQEVDDPLQETKDFGKRLANYFAKVHQIMDEYDCLLQRVATLEAENARLEDTVEQLKKDDEWTSRVTYENVVEQIASNEDASKRDDARKVFEPLLKRSQVTQLRRDIKRRVKELNDESGSTFNNYGTYTEVHSGGININNKKDESD